MPKIGEKYEPFIPQIKVHCVICGVSSGSIDPLEGYTSFEHTGNATLVTCQDLSCALAKPELFSSFVEPGNVESQ